MGQWSLKLNLTLKGPDMTSSEKIEAIRHAYLLTQLDGTDYSMVEDSLETIGRILGITEADIERFQTSCGEETSI